jgi:hypothetical protein
VSVLDAWWADLDLDGFAEGVLRCLVDGAGAVAILDEPGAVTGTGDRPFVNPAWTKAVRVFLVGDRRVRDTGAKKRAAAPAADWPFTFRQGDHVYLAWSGQEAAGPAAAATFVEVVRTSGAGYAVDGLALPGPGL